MQTIQVKLETDLKRLKDRISELRVQDPFHNPERVNDNADNGIEASEEADHDRVSALLSELEEHEKTVMSALSALANGTYGTCAMCKQTIETDRLLANPTTTLCMTCEQKREQRS